MPPQAKDNGLRFRGSRLRPSTLDKAIDQPCYLSGLYTPCNSKIASKLAGIQREENANFYKLLETINSTSGNRSSFTERRSDPHGSRSRNNPEFTLSMIRTLLKHTQSLFLLSEHVCQRANLSLESLHPIQQAHQR